MPEMRADTGVQRTSGQTIAALADEAQAILGQLQGDADATAAIWQGDAHMSFMGGTAELNAQLQKGQAAMQDVSEKVKLSATGYDGTEFDSAAALRQY